MLTTLVQIHLNLGAPFCYSMVVSMMNKYHLCFLWLLVTANSEVAQAKEKFLTFTWHEW